MNVLKLIFVLFIFCNDSHFVRLEPNIPNIFFDFESVKHKLFSMFSSVNSTQNGLECIMELNAIKTGFKNYEPWALKIVDAWGKIPSGILGGNLFEMGAFSQCFQIQRDQKPYKTQYCLGKLVFNKTSTFRYRRPHTVAQTPFTQLAQTILPDENSITFGMCLPAACTLSLLEPILNNLIHEKVKPVSVKLSNGTCQFEESPSEFHTLDKFALVLFGIVAFFILASTSYDIFCTIYTRNTSQLLIAFSVYSNGRKLLYSKKSKSSDIGCLHGLPAISMQWIMFGHVLFLHVLLPFRNLAIIPTFLATYHSTFYTSAVMAVDTFFVLSGYLISINLLKIFETRGKVNIPLLYLHRFLRLTPLLGISFFFSMSLLRFLGSGPLWPSVLSAFVKPCEKYWWSTLLYVQNYVNPNEMCFPHSWYLSVDMQLYVIAPAIVYLIYRFRIKMMPILLLSILGCIGGTVATYMIYNVKFLGNETENMQFIYYPTHIRFSPWLVGVIFGYIFVEAQKRPVNMSKMFKYSAWTLSLAAIIYIVIQNYPFQQLDNTTTAIEFGFYNGLSRVGWACAICYIIFACVHGYGGPVNHFLSHPLWQPISRISYSLYLIHFPVIQATMATMKTSPYFSELSVYQIFMSNYVLTIFISMVATLAFESPIIAIEKILFESANRSEANEQNTENETQQNQDETPTLSDSYSRLS